MKSICLILATLSLAAAGQLHHSVMDAMTNGQPHELLSSSHGVQPGNSMSVPKDYPTALGIIDRVVDISTVDIADKDQDLFIMQICQYIESLFYSLVICPMCICNNV